MYSLELDSAAAAAAALEVTAATADYCSSLQSGLTVLFYVVLCYVV
jgi:hypothetical protein